MRVLVVNDIRTRSSAAGVAVAQSEGLAARGHEVAFLATTTDPAAALRVREGGVDVRVEPVPAYPLRFRAWRSLDDPAGTALMASAVEEFRPEIVHVHNVHIHLSWASLAAAGANGAKVVLHVHDAMPVCHQKLFCHLDERLVPGDPVRYKNGPVKCALCVRGRYNPFRNGRIRSVIARHVDRLVAVSDEMGRLLAMNGIGPATTIFNGMAMPPLDHGDAGVAALRARLGLGDRRVVLYGGRLDRLKGGLELVSALEIVRRRHPDVALVTVGESLPGFREDLDAHAERLGLADAMFGTGWLTGDELAAAYRLAAVVATPSLCFESFGLINLEAMAASRPVVASFWGGPSDVVEDGVTGFLVNPLQVPVMAARLGRLLDDPALAASMGAAGRRRAERLFSLPVHVDAVERLYGEMTGSAA